MPKTKKYNLKLIFNEQTFNKRTSDIKEAILSVTPDQVYTELYLIVSPVGSKDLTERHLNLPNAKKLFRDEVYLDIFINNLLLTNG